MRPVALSFRTDNASSSIKTANNMKSSGLLWALEDIVAHEVLWSDGMIYDPTTSSPIQ